MTFRIWEDHIENVRGWKHPKHLGYFTTGGMVALVIATVFLCLDLLMLLNYLKVYARSFDPRFQLQSLASLQATEPVFICNSKLSPSCRGNIGSIKLKYLLNIDT